MDLVSSIALGVCLSAACGFRVFIPLLVMSAAGLGGYFTPAEELAWVASWPALTLFGAATIVEILGYYIPWIDNILDTIATPAALLAGALASASVLGDFPPIFQWTLAIVAGAGSAGIVQAGTVFLRGASSAITGGLGNFSIATLEGLLSLLTAVFALIVPLVTLLAIIVLGIYVWRFVRRRRKARSVGGM